MSKRKRTVGGQPRTRSDAAQAAWQRGGAGPHGKTRKALRRADKINLRKEI